MKCNSCGAEFEGKFCHNCVSAIWSSRCNRRAQTEENIRYEQILTVQLIPQNKSNIDRCFTWTVNVKCGYEQFSLNNAINFFKTWELM